MRRNCASNSSKPKIDQAPPPRGESRAHVPLGGRVANGANPGPSTSRPGALTTRRTSLRPQHSPNFSGISPKSSGTSKTTPAMNQPLTGPKNQNSGSQRSSNTSAASGGSSFKCNCGRNYLSKATLARHQKDCGVRDTSACQYCGRAFPTFAGVRQHERVAHPELYQKELEDKLPVPETELYVKLADIEAGATDGIFYQAMVDATGLTRQQVRYRRERPEYQAYLARARKKKLGERKISPRAPLPCPQTPRAMRASRRLQSRELGDGHLAPADVVAPVPHEARRTRKTATIATTNKIPVVVLNRIPEEKTGPPSAGFVASANVGGRRSPSPSHDVPSPQPSHAEATSATRPIHGTISPLSTVSTKAPRHRLSTSLPSLLVPESGVEAVSEQSKEPPASFRNYFSRILNESPEEIQTIDGAVDAVRAALEEPSDLVLNNVDRWLTTFSKGGRQGKRQAGKAKGKTGPRPANYGQTNTGRNPRAASFKKAQDLFTKNRKGLADAILEGRELEAGTGHPSMDQMEDLFGGILEKPSNSDDEPFDRLAFGNEDALQPISVEEIVAAKNGWRVSAAGADGVPVQAVRDRSNVELCILFNVILCSNVQPTTWRKIRTTLVPKNGDKLQPTNWRPISVGSAVQRLLHRVLVARLKTGVSFSEHQRGFVETDGTLANAMILDQYITRRTDQGKGYHVVSLDIRKAFDTVSHHSIRRALRRFGVPGYMESYIMSTFDAVTTLNLGGCESRPINFRSGVRQGDPLSPLLFNAIVDELLVSLNSKFAGGTLPNEARCAAMAFADDLILMSDKQLDIPLMLDEVEQFLRARGMEVNAAKCRALVATTAGGRSVARSRAIFHINDKPIPSVPSLNAFRYLGHEFGHGGVEKPGLFRLPEWLRNISKAPLKPDQKLTLIKVYVLPRLLYSLQNPKITSRTLRDADRLIRKTVRAVLHLNAHTPDAAIHASIRDGGLGVMELRTAIPRIFLGRLTGLLERSSDLVVTAVLQSEHSRALMAKLERMAGDVPGATAWRAKIVSGVLTKGLEQAAEDSASRAWVDAKPAGWSGRDYVRAVQLRTANLPTKAIPSNPADQRRCRGGCHGDENISHVLQTCPVTHWERIRRHDEICSKIARHCKAKKWVVEEEPHVRHRNGQLFKPDLVVHQSDGVTVVADVQVAWDAGDLGRAYERKRVVYDNATFREAAARRWPGKTLLFTPIIVGARGIWPRVNNERSAVLDIGPAVRRSCVLSALKWGSTIHTAFMKAVWRKSRNPRLLPSAGE